jgi:DNA repair protein RadC
MSDQRKTIKDLPEDERPREKLLKYGADKLSDSELLAILLRTGTRGKSVIEMAEEILKNTGGTFKGLAGKDMEDITKMLGVKNAKVATVAAALEISRRVSKQILKDRGII